MNDKASEATSVSPDQLDINRLAFEQGLKGLASQEETLSSLRQRGSAVAALSGLAATFLGRLSFSDSKPPKGPVIAGLGIVELIALLALLVSIIAVVQLLRPRGDWFFHFSPRLIIDQFARGPKAASLSKTYEVLARFAEDNYDKNVEIFKILFIWLWVAFGGLFVQLYCWLLALTN